MSPGCVSLPHDIVVHILSRLPAKSLCRFRFVCNQWLGLISDPHFVKLHLNQTNRHKIILSRQSFYSIDAEEADSEEIDFPLKKEGGFIQILGSCNGLLCLMIERGVFFLFNPSTRQSKRIPDCEKESFSFFPLDIYGFGYAESIDDYKFVKIILGWGSISTMSVSVFSLRTESWKKVPACGYSVGTSGKGALLHEAMHWPLRKQNGNFVIGAFDLVEERFRELPLPEGSTGFKLFQIRVLGGCLCLLRFNIHSEPKEFWIMKEYAVQESWTRVFILGPNDEVPLLFWKNSHKILLINNKNLLLRNFNSASEASDEDFVVVAELPNWKNLSNIDWACVYVESLVPPALRNCN